MKPKVETNRETGTMKIDNIEFNVEQTKAINHLLEAFEKKITNQVCNKIRLNIEDMEHSEENEAKQSSESVVYTEELLKLLDEIELVGE